MPNYQLNIDFVQDDLAAICKAGEKVVLLKKTNSGTPVAWVSFYPMLSNTVLWEEDYAVYSTTQSVQNGASIIKMSDVEAFPQNIYPFTNCGFFGAPTSDKSLPLAGYEIKNEWQKDPLLTFGMAQGVQVNGTAFPYKPINAQAVPKNQQVTFEPLTEVEIFLQNNIESGMVLTRVFSNQSTLTFGGNTVDITVRYDSSTGQFVTT